MTLGSTYVALIADGMINAPPDAPPMDFFSLEGITTFFQTSTQKLLVAACLHYCVFDLLAGQWITNDFIKNVKDTTLTNVFRIVSLGFTLMFGPSGFCLYLFGKYTFLPPKTGKDEEDDTVVSG